MAKEAMEKRHREELRKVDLKLWGTADLPYSVEKELKVLYI